MKWNGSEIVMVSAGEWPMALCQVCMLILVFLFFRYILAVRLSSADELTSKDTVVKEQMKGEALFAGAQFSMGTIVRVKGGTMDPDRGNISFGGWTGTIDGIGHGVNPKIYLIKWSQETLDQMPAAYRKRCQHDDIEVERTWLGEDDLESKPGEQTGVWERYRRSS